MSKHCQVTPESGELQCSAVCLEYTMPNNCISAPVKFFKSQFSISKLYSNLAGQMGS